MLIINNLLDFSKINSKKETNCQIVTLQGKINFHIGYNSEKGEYLLYGNELNILKQRIFSTSRKDLLIKKLIQLFGKNIKNRNNIK